MERPLVGRYYRNTTITRMTSPQSPLMQALVTELQALAKVPP
jgi:hypothetical protein